MNKTENTREVTANDKKNSIFLHYCTVCWAFKNLIMLSHQVYGTDILYFVFIIS